MTSPSKSISAPLVTFCLLSCPYCFRQPASMWQSLLDCCWNRNWNCCSSCCWCSVNLYQQYLACWHPIHLSVYPYLANSTDRLMQTLLGNCSPTVGGGACLSGFTTPPSALGCSSHGDPLMLLNSIPSPESSFGTLRMLLEKQFRVAFQPQRSQIRL